LHAAAAILAVAFLTKAAIWPLNFWLVPAYTAASAPVAALFALMTKVGIYALLRIWTLVFSAAAGPSAYFGAHAFLYGGLLTGAFGIFGLMASLRLGNTAGFSIIVSSGTLLGTIGIHRATVTASALFYLISATLAASALYLLVELVERPGVAGDRVPLADVNTAPGEDTNLDDEEAALVGRVIPVPLALLGLAFIACALLTAGLPPLSGFVAKVVLAGALLSTDNLGISPAPRPLIWSLFGLLLVSGLVATVSLARSGIRHFWSPGQGSPRLTLMEGAPVVTLILVCAALTASAEPVLRYTTAAAEALHSPGAYIHAVLSTKPVPGPARPGVDPELP
jgi:multicomponent K+:H+ antiporter subunit D